MGDFQFPVFVRLNDCGDVRRYNSVAEMQYDFEQIDVEYKEYGAWDANGIPLTLSVQKMAAWLRLEPAGPPKPEQLMDAIKEFARLQSVEVDTSSLSGGDFSGALEQVTSAALAKLQAKSWWQRFKHRF